MHNLSVFNSLTGKKERFVPLDKDLVKMYVCGPTVYSFVHLGNCRTFISFDVIYRYLLHLGYRVKYVRNITDVGHLENDSDDGDDLIVKKARKENIEPMEVVQKYTVDFHENGKKWNSPWGEGFPGWHTECSAMNENDNPLISIVWYRFFPHHDCEIAQSEALNENSKINYWLHSNMLTLNGKKCQNRLEIVSS